MDLVFLHGPPAVGKLTVARELARLTGLRLFHNHLVVDALLAVFEFGTPPFVTLREQIWLDVFRAAARDDTSLIFTFSPENTVTPGFVPRVVETVDAEAGRVRFVALTCPDEVLELRLQAASREGTGKLRSVEQYRTLRAEGAFDAPPVPDADLTIDTSRVSPGVAAAQIRDALGA